MFSRSLMVKEYLPFNKNDDFIHKKVQSPQRVGTYLYIFIENKKISEHKINTNLIKYVIQNKKSNNSKTKTHFLVTNYSENKMLART
jgi:hypothetical protein